MTKLYREPDGSWSVPGQQSKAAERIDVPGAPGELARWLTVARAAAEVPPPPPDEAPPRCPNCGMNRREAERNATAYFDSLTAAAVAEKVMELDGYQLGNVLHAGCDRLRELEARARRLGEKEEGALGDLFEEA